MGDDVNNEEYERLMTEGRPSYSELRAERDRLRDLLGRTIEYMEPPPIEDAPRFADLLADIRKELEEKK